MDTGEYLSVLNKEQLEAVVHTGSPLLILAGAGSGKTRVITTKIAYMISELGYYPSSILAVTFTKKAANEMMQRAQQLEILAAKSQIRTFHSFGSWFLRLYYEEAQIDRNFTVYDDDDMVTLLQKAVPHLDKQKANYYAHKISLAKDYCLVPESEGLIEIDSDPEFSSIYQSYQQRLRQTGNVDFGDLIMMPVLIMRENEKIRHYMHNRFKVVMVDEYQDSNVAQFALLEQLVGKDTYVCVVGDDDQSIYKFRGAEVKNIISFPDHFPNTKIIKLEKNYRSIAPILHAADVVVSNNSQRLGKTLQAVRNGEKKPVLAFLSRDDDEIKFAKELIQNSHKIGVPYADWAILYRTNAQSMGFETAFLHDKIPYSVVGSLKFYQREEIKDALSFLSFLSNPKDEISFRRIINKPARGIGNVTQDKIVNQAKNNITEKLLGNANLLDACFDILPKLSASTKDKLKTFLDIIEQLKAILDDENNQIDYGPTAQLAIESLESVEIQQKENSLPQLSELIDKMVKKSGLVEYYEGQDAISNTQKVENLQQLINSAQPYPLNRKGLTEFLDHIELDRTLELKENEDENPDRVTLITLHNTKGLEFSRVIITGLEFGVFPRKDKVDDELEEERRLFYVGITRAKDELYMTSCAFRRMYGKSDYMEISPFLLELDKSQLVIKGHPPTSFSFGKSKLDNLSENPIANRWKKGIKVYHDDYGYGYIISTDDTQTEYVINVQFETGEIKKFMPKYQANHIMIVQD